MQKKIINLFYMILLKSAENYYGESLKDSQIAYKTDFFS